MLSIIAMKHIAINVPNRIKLNDEQVPMSIKDLKVGEPRNKVTPMETRVRQTI